MATMSGIAGMGEAEELLSFDMVNNADPRTPLRDKNNETNTNNNDNDDDETNNNMSYGSMSYGSMSYGSMSMSMNDDCSTTAGGSTRSSTRSSRRRNKRKNKENNSSSSNSFVSQNSSFLNSNSSVIIGGGNSKSKNPYLKRKEKEIDFILSQSPNIDLWKLRELALTPGGLVNGKFLYIYIYKF
jgi:hypothetical protein